MQTGDGLLARLAVAEPIAAATFIELCAAAQAHGNGVIEVTGRGSLQVRGLRPDSAPRFAAAVLALGLGEAEAVRVLTDALAGDEARALATALRTRPVPPGLGPKVSVLIDSGGALHLDALAADIRLHAVPGGYLVAVGGTAHDARVLGLVAADACPRPGAAPARTDRRPRPASAWP